MSVVKVRTKEYKLPPSIPTSGYFLGCDPEFFIKRRTDNKIVGSELLLGNKDAKLHADSTLGGTVIVDGVQVELNPSPTFCRANLANSMIACFKELKKKLDTSKEFQADFSTTVEVTKEELDKLHENSRKFGCAPSLNGHTASTSVIPYKGDEYLKRSAGGHIHIGIGAHYHKDPETIKRLVYMMDILVGIPSVLLDRDPNNIERRKVYGRAGEYRLPPHGFEYRTLSNFWLRGYPIMSLVFGLTKIAGGIACYYYDVRKRDDYLYRHGYETKELYALIIETVDSIGGIKQVENAINNNDFDLAYKIWNAVEPILLAMDIEKSDKEGSVGISKSKMYLFHYLVYKGIDTLFPKDNDIITYWATHGDAHTGGISDYYYTTLEKMYQKDLPIILENVILGLTKPLPSINTTTKKRTRSHLGKRKKKTLVS